MEEKREDLRWYKEKTRVLGHEIEVLAYIVHYMDEHQYAPTVREIGAGLGFKSTSTTQYYLQGLEEAGFIKRLKGCPRAISVASYDECKELAGMLNCNKKQTA